MDKNDIYELGQLLSTVSPSGWVPRPAVVQEIRSHGDITIFKSVGVGVQDVAIAHAVVDHAKRCNIGTYIPQYDVS